MNVKPTCQLKDLKTFVCNTFLQCIANNITLLHMLNWQLVVCITVKAFLRSLNIIKCYQYACKVETKCGSQNSLSYHPY